jgi:hypothetical protein
MRWLWMLVLLVGCFGDGGDPQPLDRDQDGFTDDVDCDDFNPAIYPGANDPAGDGLDQDCDGQDTPGAPDADGDGVTAEFDCDDDDPNNSPIGIEVCDGQDNDCDDAADEGFDEDGDGVPACGPDGAYDTADDDCDDEDADRYPGNPEVCDGRDNNCNGDEDEGFDADGDGVPTCGRDGVPGTDDDDCNDNDATIVPDSWDACSGADTNCNGLVDEDGDYDGDGWQDCEGDPDRDCDDLNPDINPAATEVCNGADDDCDGTADPGCTDADGDGWSVPSDCDDTDASVYPGAGDDPGDGIDGDCDGDDQASDCASAQLNISETEPNNTPNQPNLVSAGGQIQVSGECAQTFDLDNFVLNLNCGGAFTLEVTGSPDGVSVLDEGDPVGVASAGSPLNDIWVPDGQPMTVVVNCGTSTGPYSFLIDWN